MGENLFYMRAADVFMIDVPWNGFAQSKKIGYLAETYQFNVAPHNYYSHLSTFISASLCAVLPNVRIQEIDVDDVPWREEMVTIQPDIQKGHLKIPTGPGWGH
jgi:galactonate dehydratase